MSINVPRHSKRSSGVRMGAACYDISWKRNFTTQMTKAGFTRLEIDDLIGEAGRRLNRGHSVSRIVADMKAKHLQHKPTGK